MAKKEVMAISARSADKVTVDDSFDVQEGDEYSLLPQQNRRLLMKTNLVVLPIMIIASTLAFLDKVGFRHSCWLVRLLIQECRMLWALLQFMA